MKHTGIIRRLDDLGRIVIPKAVRQPLGLEEGQPMEISFDADARTVILTPYDPSTYETEGGAKL